MNDKAIKSMADAAIASRGASPTDISVELRHRYREDMRAALAVDPLRARLGEEAVKAIMEGKAAVVPFIEKGSGRLVIDDSLKLLQFVQTVECSQCDHFIARLDRGEAV